MTTDQLMPQAIDHHRAGRLREAETIYRQLLTQQPNHTEALHGLGIMALQLGRHEIAIDLLSRCVALDPSAARYQCSLAQALAGAKRYDQAITHYRRSITLQPTLAEALFGLGIVLQNTKRFPEAAEVYQKALGLRGDWAEAQTNLGAAYHQMGRHQEAIACYERTLALRPEYTGARHNLGAALQVTGRLDEAIVIFRSALAQQPRSIDIINSLANALVERRQFAEAIATLRGGLAHAPDSAITWYNLGNALRLAGEFSESAAAYRRALALRPDHYESFNNLGHALQALGDFPGAAETYRRAIAIRPDYVEAMNNLGVVLRSLGDVDGSIKVLDRALGLRPDLHVAHCNLGNAFKDSGELDKAIASYRRAVELKSTDSATHSNVLYALHFHPDYDAAAILREHQQWNRMHAQPLAPAAPVQARPAGAPPRLRIGYVAADFRAHCQALFTIPLLSHHDRRQFEIFCYSNLPNPDVVTERIRGYTDGWRSIAGVPDEQAAAMVRADRIDILVDLTMHMANGRLLLFARKPAPIQATWLAYPGTTGLPVIDYRLTDPYLDPPGEADAAYCEKSLRLPHTFWCYDPMDIEPVPNDLPAPNAGHITFGCLNNFCKVSPPAVALWSRVLNRLPGSRLILMSSSGQHRQRLLAQFSAAGIEVSRIEFLPFRARRTYLETYHRIDIGLDTIPYNGHTTSLDSFWMGVPVVTRIGQTVVGRAGWSQLCNLDLRELAAGSDEEFVRIAVELAGDLPRLRQMRSTLRQRMQQSPLMDARQFARDMENAYRRMWAER